jgi:hypothetical protein
VLATERFADDDDLDAAEVRDRLVGAEVALVVGIEESAEWGAQNRIRQAFPLSSPPGLRRSRGCMVLRGCAVCRGIAQPTGAAGMDATWQTCWVASSWW